MASITEHVMINKLGDDLDSAITFVGGDTSNVTNIMQYPQIIRDQLGCGMQPRKEIILEGDSCIIEADEQGRDVYNTEYAIGEKTGLNPGTLYLRLCTAVKDIEPVYIDLTRISSGSDADIEAIINQIIDDKLNDYVTKSDVASINDRLVVLEKKDEQDLEYIIRQVIESDTIQNTFISHNEMDEMILDEDQLEDILTI